MQAVGDDTGALERLAAVGVEDVHGLHLVQQKIRGQAAQQVGDPRGVAHAHQRADAGLLDPAVHLQKLQRGVHVVADVHVLQNARVQHRLEDGHGQRVEGAGAVEHQVHAGQGLAQAGGIRHVHVRRLHALGAPLRHQLLPPVQVQIRHDDALESVVQRQGLRGVAAHGSAASKYDDGRHVRLLVSGGGESLGGDGSDNNAGRSRDRGKGAARDRAGGRPEAK